MILLRGIKGKNFAQKIDAGIVGFRDLLSTLLYTNKTGYKYSDYYEKYFINTHMQLMMPALNYFEFEEEIRDKFMLIFNNTIPYIYITYFHVLNDKSISNWLSKFEDDMEFIFIEPKLDSICNNMTDENLFGRKMEYIKNINDVNTTDFIMRSAGILQFINTDIKNSVTDELAMSYSGIIFNLMLRLFTREVDTKYSDIENEFRIIYKIPTVINPKNYELEPQEKRIFNVKINESLQYYGSTNITKDEVGCKYCDMPLTAKNPVLRSYRTSFVNEVRKGSSFNIESDFKDINITNAVYNYGYIGDKDNCQKFILQKLNDCNF